MSFMIIPFVYIKSHVLCLSQCQYDYFAVLNACLVLSMECYMRNIRIWQPYWLDQHWTYFLIKNSLGLLVCHSGDLIEMHCGKINSVAISSLKNPILTGLTGYNTRQESCYVSHTSSKVCCQFSPFLDSICIASRLLQAISIQTALRWWQTTSRDN